MIDVAIIGGGIAGLWTMQRLRRMGYDAHVFEIDALGTGQTIASQGIIHSGIKYGLAGLFRRDLAHMPERWNAAMRGSGEVDLRKVQVLETCQGVRSEWALVERALGRLVRDPVIDVKSLLRALGTGAHHAGGFIELPKAKATLYAAGRGNNRLMEASSFGLPVGRPLRMVMIRGMDHPLFEHVMGMSSKPLATVTSHRFDGAWVWYVGGQVAERATSLDEESAVAFARERMAKLYPQETFTGCAWAVHNVTRWEGPGSGTRPTLIRWDSYQMAIGWPGKMALAPAFSDLVNEWLDDIGVKPSDTLTEIGLPAAPVARYPWETAANWITLPA